MRSKITALAIAVLLSTVSLSVLAPGISGSISEVGERPFAGGTGAIFDPFIVENVWELHNISTDMAAHYALGNDIDATITSAWNWNLTTSGFEGFIPIGCDMDNSTENLFEGTRFSGSLDGRNYTIDGLFINRSALSYQGLFGGMAVTAVVKDLTMINTLVVGKNYTGGIAGDAWTDEFDNVQLSGNITGLDYVGGLVGSADVNLDIIDCHTMANVNGNSWVGGIAGRGGLSIISSSASGTVTGTASSVGGIVGFLSNNGLMENCTVTGTVDCVSYAGGAAGQVGNCVVINTTSDVNISGAAYLGGLIGYMTGGSVENCHSMGYTSGTNRVGGLIGETTLTTITISNSSASGDVDGSSNAGGLIGTNDAEIYGCSADGLVNGTSINVGGLIGYNTGTVNMSHSTGDTGGTNDYVGSFAGRNDGNIMNCYSIGNANGRIHVGGFIGANLGTISYSYSTGNANGSMEYVGGFTGSSSGTISNCSSTGMADGSSDWVGGFTGWSNGDISDSYSTGDTSGTTNVGGFIGYNEAGTVTNCSAHGMVNGTGNNVGGLIGQNTGTVNMTHATGNVGSTGGTGHGGLIGYSSGGDIELSYAVGDVHGVENVGGLCGWSDHEISLSFAMGEANATGDYAGGLIGYKDGGGIRDCYARGNAIGLQGVGGLFGGSWGGQTTNCYSTGNASGTTFVGGFVGERWGGGSTYTDCHWDNQTSGTEINIGNGDWPGIHDNYTAEMMMQATFVNWDFTSTWGIDENTSYPYLLANQLPAAPIIAELGIDITDSMEPVMVGYTYDYNVTVTNYGPDNATAVNATIHIPIELQFISSNQTTSFWGMNNLSWDIGNLTSGQVVYWNITVTVLGGATGTLNCTVDVIANTAENGTYPNDAFELTLTNQAPVADNDFPTIAEDSGANTIDVMTNDNDPDAGDSITIAGITQGADGTVVITNGGADLTYEPDADFNGTDSFTYTITDLYGITDTATVSITVTNTNDAPVANDDTATCDQDGGIIYIDVLDNDSDLDGDGLTIDAITQGTDGTVMIETGNVSYEPDAGFSGTDTFTYTIIDGNGGSDTATVNVTVVDIDQAPIAVNDTATQLEDSNATIIDVLGNDSDADGDSITITAVTQPANGAVEIIDSGTNVTYMPDPDFFGLDTFNYTINDGSGHTATATVTVDVTNVNDGPIIEDFTVPVGTIGEEYILIIQIIDVDNDTFSMSSSISSPDTELSTITNTQNLTFTVSGTPSVNGTSTVHFEADDGNGGTVTLEFDIIVGGSTTDPTDNTTATDSDGDGVPDVDDAFPNDATEDTDTDGDGTGDNADAFPNDATEDTDTDGDGIGNNEDTDDDGDGTPDVDDDTPIGEDDDVEDGGIMEYWWILLIIAIVLILIIVLMRRKKTPLEGIEEEMAAKKEPVEETTPEPEEAPEPEDSGDGSPTEDVEIKE